MINKLKRKYLTFFVLTVFWVVLSGYSHQRMNGSFQGWDHMMGYGGVGVMFMWLIWLLIVGIIIYVVFSRINHSKKNDNPPPQNYLDILKNRYAGGEISKEEFERLKKELES